MLALACGVQSREAGFREALWGRGHGQGIGQRWEGSSWNSVVLRAPRRLAFVGFTPAAFPVGSQCPQRRRHCFAALYARLQPRLGGWAYGCRRLHASMLCGVLRVGETRGKEKGGVVTHSRREAPREPRGRRSTSANGGEARAVCQTTTLLRLPKLLRRPYHIAVGSGRTHAGGESPALPHRLSSPRSRAQIAPTHLDAARRAPHPCRRDGQPCARDGGGGVDQAVV
eukprot:203360-Chlamydomonas_euryale.AAC.2